MKKILCLLFMISLSIFLLTGCFDYDDINRVIFVTMAIIDLDDEGNYVLYAEAFHSFRSNETNAEKGERLFFEMRGVTLFDAARDFNRQAAFKVDYTQMKVIIVTESVAEKGLNHIVDVLERSQQTILRNHIVITDEDPEEILSFPIKQNEYIGLFINELMENPFLIKMFRVDRINQYLNQRYQEGHTHVLSYLSIDDNPVDARMSVDGGAILVEDKLVGRLEEEEMHAWRFLTDRIDRGLIVFPSNDDEDETTHIVVDTVHSKTKTSLEFDGSKILLSKTINIKTVIAETQSPLILDFETSNKIEKQVEEVIIKNCEELFNRMKEENFDVFDIGGELKRKYPDVDIEDPIQVTDLNIVVNNHLMGSQNTTGFR